MEIAHPIDFKQGASSEVPLRFQPSFRRWHKPVRKVAQHANNGK
jgi:hypothetical protein